jgi:hypothetical protein
MIHSADLAQRSYRQHATPARCSIDFLNLPFLQNLWDDVWTAMFRPHTTRSDFNAPAPSWSFGFSPIYEWHSRGESLSSHLIPSTGGIEILLVVFHMSSTECRHGGETDSIVLNGRHPVWRSWHLSMFFLHKFVQARWTSTPMWVHKMMIVDAIDAMNSRALCHQVAGGECLWERCWEEVHHKIPTLILVLYEDALFMFLTQCDQNRSYY